MIAVELGPGHTRYLRDVRAEPVKNQFNNPITSDADIIDFIRSQPMQDATLREVARNFELSEPHVSNVLKRMFDSGLLFRQRKGHKMLYTLEER